jgi:hypothetical protein
MPGGRRKEMNEEMKQIIEKLNDMGYTVQEIREHEYCPEGQKIHEFSLIFFRNVNEK